MNNWENELEQTKIGLQAMIGLYNAAADEIAVLKVERYRLRAEITKRRTQRCETCGNSAETLGPPFDSVGCKEHHGWWPKSGYCHLWKGGTDDEAGA